MHKIVPPLHALLISCKDCSSFFEAKRHFSLPDQAHCQAGNHQDWKAYFITEFVPNNTSIPYFKTGWTKGYLGLAFSNTDIPSGKFLLLTLSLEFQRM